MTDKKITLGFVGDFCLARAHNRPDRYIDNAYRISKILNEKVDLAVANFEFCISLPGVIENSGMFLPESFAEGIADAGFAVFCLANNHIGDFGEETLLYNKQFLKDRGHYTAGIGKNLEHATRPLFLEKNGFKIAIINVCDATYYAAKKKSAGLAHLEKKMIIKVLQEAKLEADVIIVCIHSDLEFINSPAPWRVSLSREIAELGADLIIHHHPHTLQGIEYWSNTLIAYSLGNYIFPIRGSEYMSNRDGYVDESIYLSVSLVDKPDGSRLISHKITPLIIDDDNMTCFPSAEKEQEIRIKMSEYSSILNNSSVLRRNFFNMCKKQMKKFLMETYYMIDRKEYRLAWRNFIHHLSSKSHTNWIIGFFTFGKY